MKHVLLIPAYFSRPQHPSAGRYVLDQALLLQRAGLQVGILFVNTQDGSLSPFAQLKHYEQEGIAVLRRDGWLPPKKGPQLFAYYAARFRKPYAAYVKRYGRPDLLHAHTYWAAAGAELLAREHGLPWFCSYHSSKLLPPAILPDWESALLARLLRQATRNIAVSAALRKGLLLHAKEARITVLPNAVDTDLFSPSVQPGDRFVVAYVGDLIPSKLVSLLLEAFAMFYPRRQDRLWIIGQGPETAALKKQAREIGIEEQTQFLGELPREQVAARLRQASILGLPSRRETFGVVLIEAMASGIPVLSTPSGGPEGIITPQTGRLLPADAAAWAKVFRDMRLGYLQFDRGHIRDYAEQHFSNTVLAEQLLSLYDGG